MRGLKSLMLGGLGVSELSGYRVSCLIDRLFVYHVVVGRVGHDRWVHIMVVVITSATLAQNDWEHDGQYHDNKDCTSNESPLDVLLAILILDLVAQESAVLVIFLRLVDVSALIVIKRMLLIAIVVLIHSS